MSVRLRMRVLRLRQLSIGRLYDRVEQACNLHLAVLRQERAEPSARMRELASRTSGLALLRAPPGGRQMPQPGDELPLAEPGGLVERPRRLGVLAAEQVALGPPEDALQARLGRRPVVRTRVVVHGHDRA
jgi:hypothetical protein